MYRHNATHNGKKYKVGIYIISNKIYGILLDKNVSINYIIHIIMVHKFVY